MGMYAALGISATGLAAERLRMDVIASNLANADSTNGVGDAYHRKAVTMAEASGGGVQFSLPRPAGLGGAAGSDDLHGVAVTGIVEDPAPLRKVYEPGHPDADANGLRHPAQRQRRRRDDRHGRRHPRLPGQRDGVRGHQVHGQGRPEDHLVSPLPPITGLASMPFGPITATDGPSAADARPPRRRTPASRGILSSAISGLNGQLVSSEHLSEQAATGQLADPTVALVAVEKADLAFNTAVQVRNKLVEGWQEISRMQV